MLAVVTLLWAANEHSKDFSSMYDESWVERLYWGFERNLTREFEFICYVDRPREFTVPVTQVRLSAIRPDYGHCIEPYKLGRPMILVGLDTIVTGNIDHLADYCTEGGRFACPRDPYYPHQVCNGVALVPAGMERIGFEWRGDNDMVWVRKYDPAVIDDLWPGQVVSYKGHVKQHGLGDARMVYFHGQEKAHQLTLLDWVRQHWNGEDMADAARMDPRSGNHPALLPGEIVKGASGWKDREMRAERRLQKKTDEERAAIRAARARLAASETAAPIAEVMPAKKPKPEPVAEPVAVVAAEIEPATVAEAEPAEAAPAADLYSEMAWEDLKAYYEQATGQKVGNRMRRADVEAALRDAGDEELI